MYKSFLDLYKINIWLVYKSNKHIRIFKKKMSSSLLSLILHPLSWRGVSALLYYCLFLLIFRLLMDSLKHISCEVQLYLLLRLSRTLCPCLGAWGRVGGAGSFSLQSVLFFLPPADAHCCSGGSAPGPCSETLSAAEVAAEPVCQTAPAWSRPHKSWAAVILNKQTKKVIKRRGTCQSEAEGVTIS